MNLLYPSDACCIVCNSVTDIKDNLCCACSSSLVTVMQEYPSDENTFCRACSRPVPTNRGGYCRTCAADETKVFGAAPFMHKNAAAELVHKLKFGSIESAARILAEYMSPLCPKDADALVPIPLAKPRRRERGFNQAALLCNEISRITKVPVRDILLRTKKMKPQVGLTSEERRSNPVGAFAMADNTQSLADYKHIILVDDVRTTGSTALAASLVLYERGAARVSLLTATLSN